MDRIGGRVVARAKVVQEETVPHSTLLHTARGNEF
jgi:hypothetical protein